MRKKWRGKLQTSWELTSETSAIGTVIDNMRY